MNKSSVNGTIDSSILKIFKLFSGGVFLVHLILLFISLTVKSDNPLENKIITLFIITYGLIFLYLKIPVLPLKLKSFYLPPPLIAASIIPIGITNLKFRMYSQAGIPIDALSDSMTITILLIFPLIITAWQYRFPIVFLFFVVLGFMDPFMLIMANEHLSKEIYNIVNISLIRILALGSVGFIITELRNQQRMERRALEEANKKLEEYAASSERLAVSRERNRIARDLHDTLAHTLSGLAIQLEAMETISEKENSGLKPMIEKAAVTVRNGLDETRRALKALRASPLEELGLAAALEKLADDYGNRGNFRISITVPEETPEWSTTLEENVYRIAQEALENILKHSGAEKAEIILSGNNDYLNLTVKDNGRGFKTYNFHELGRFGLWGMNERAAAAGGKLTVNSNIGEGTEIKFTWSQIP